MNLKNLVPPLELCKLIPAGEFADSALVWETPSSSFPEDQKFHVFIRRRNVFMHNKDMIPAPTLQEILEDGDPIYELHVKHKPGANQSMVGNALKAWLKRMNVKYEVCLWCGGNMTGDYDNTICPHCGQRTEKVEVIK
jgi:hypothetical protein